MTRLLATALLLCACSQVALPPPVVCTVDDLPAGVLARADLETQTITLAPWFDTLPVAVQWVTVAHEVCHLHGMTTEAGADCCAADAVARLWGRALVLEAALWLQARGYDINMIVECLP